MNAFEKNIAALREKYPGLVEKLLSEPLLQDWEVHEDESGQKTARYSMGNGLYRYIHSRINLSEEAVKWAALAKHATGTRIVLGFGLGYHVMALMREDCFRQIIIVEYNWGLFRLAMDIIDLTPVLLDSRCLLLIGEALPAARQLLGSSFQDPISYSMFLPSIELHAQYYKGIRNILEDHIFKYRIYADPLLNESLKKLLQATVQ